jgi:hypothetical protein
MKFTTITLLACSIALVSAAPLERRDGSVQSRQNDNAQVTADTQVNEVARSTGENGNAVGIAFYKYTWSGASRN